MSAIKKIIPGSLTFVSLMVTTLVLSSAIRLLILGTRELALQLM